MKYHISKNGEPKPCRAKKSCPLGENNPHFDTEEEAFQYIADSHNAIQTVSKQPKWFKDKLAEYKKQGSNLELLEEFEHNGKQLTFAYTPQSIKPGDMLIDSGMRVSQYEVYDDSGERVGYLKVTQVTDESFERGFGKADDYLTNLRYHSRFSGTSLPLTDPETDEPIDVDSLPGKKKDEILRATWTRVFNSYGSPPPDSTKRLGIKRSSWSWSNEDQPEKISDVEIDLKKFAKTKDAEVRGFREYFAHKFVDFSRMDDAYKGTGLGKKMYVKAGQDLAKHGEILRGSGIQSDDAERLWKSLGRTEPVKFIKLRGYRGQDNPYSDYPTLDYR